MRFSVMSLVASALSATLFLLAPAGTALAAEVSLRADAWCPYNCEAGNRPGYLIELATAALEGAGHKVDYALMPWTQVLEGTASGKIVAAVGAVADEAPSLIYPDLPLGMSRPTLVINRGKNITGLSADKLDGLKQLRFGLIKDYYYGERINKFIDANKDAPNLVQVSGDNVTEDLVNMLIEGKIDALVEDSNVVDYLLESKGYRNLFAYVPLGEEAEVSIGFSPKDPNSATYAKLVSAKLLEMRANGKLAEILGRYGLRDWAK